MTPSLGAPRLLRPHGRGGYMTQTPTLGPTDADAYRQAYRHGFEAFDHVDGADLLPDDADPDDVLGDGPLGLSDFEGVRVTIDESDANKRLWWALEDYYEEHKTADEQARFEREAAVAEDFDTAFGAGAYAALRGEDCDPDGDLLFLTDDE